MQQSLLNELPTAQPTAPIASKLQPARQMLLLTGTTAAAERTAARGVPSGLNGYSHNMGRATQPSCKLAASYTADGTADASDGTAAAQKVDPEVRWDLLDKSNCL